MALSAKMLDRYANNQAPELKDNNISNKKQDICCMTCRWWRYTNNGKGECMSFNKKIYTDEGFYCKTHIGGEYSS